MATNSSGAPVAGAHLARPVAESRAIRWLQAVVGIGLALAAWEGASALWALDAHAGPRAQTVNIRWASSMSSEQRQRAEVELGLREAPDAESPGTTGIYRLSRRSSRDIGRILSHPMVEDTYHIDLKALRVELDRPEITGWRRWLLDTDQTSLVGWGLVACGLLSLWSFRSGLRRVVTDAGTALRWAATAVDEFAARQVRDGWAASGQSPTLRRGEILGAVLLGAAFLLPLLLYGPSDDEEVGLGVFASQIHYQAIFHGHWLFWLDALGFGTPMPSGQRLDFHPVFALGSLVSLRLALSAVWVTHVALMIVYFQRLTVVSGIRPPLRMILLACYLFSEPSLCYFYGSDWISVIIGWSLLPALVFYVRGIVNGDAETRFWTASLRLALIAGLWLLNSHLGYLVALASVLAVYVIASTPRARAWACLATAGALVAAMSAERMYFAFSEMQMFPPSLIRSMQGGFSVYDYVSQALFPLSNFKLDLRQPFIGVVGLAAVAAMPSVLRGRDSQLRGYGLAFLAAVLLSLAPYALMLPLRVFSGVWLFRDPMVVFGLITGGIVLQRAFERVSGRGAQAVRLLVMVQLVQQSLLLWAAVNGYREHLGELQFYRHQGRPVGLARVLVENGRRFGPRLYVSDEVRTRLRGRSSPDGIHVMTDLAFLGLNPVNVWVKGVSLDRLYPSPSLMHSVIQGQHEVIENRTLLNVLGVNLVMINEGVDPAPPGLPQVGRYQPYAAGRRPFLLFANTEAWPKAVLMDVEARDLALPLRPDCPHERALCRDYEGFAQSRLQAPVDLAGHDGSYTARFPPADRERLLFVSSMFRPEFTARAMGRPLRIDPIADAFLGVTIPKGVTEVDIAFVPTVRVALTWVSSISVLAVLMAFAVAWWRGRSAREMESGPAAAW